MDALGIRGDEGRDKLGISLRGRLGTIKFKDPGRLFPNGGNPGPVGRSGHPPQHLLGGGQPWGTGTI